MTRFCLVSVLSFVVSLGYSQSKAVVPPDKSSASSVGLKIESGPKSKELSDYYRFEGIHYFNITLTGGNIADQYFILTSEEFWDGKLVSSSTLADTKKYNLKNGKDTIHITAMSKKIDRDTVKFQFQLPVFLTHKKFKSVTKDIYSLRDISAESVQIFDKKKPITLLVYTLPYEDPKNPWQMHYCELSKDGIPPEQWGEKFGVQHYIIFKIQLVD